MEENKENRAKAENRKNLLRNIKIFTGLLIIALIIVFFPDKNNKKTENVDKTEFVAVNKICELSTLKCYYHNVAEYEKKPGGIFNYGYKKFWIEYDGIVEIGIDAAEVRLSEPDKDNVVTIYVPQAKIISVSVDEYSMSDPVVDTGIFTTITTQEKANAYAEAQANMRKSAQEDTNMLNQAYNNAKELLRQYVLNVGEQVGQSYTVRWETSEASDAGK